MEEIFAGMIRTATPILLAALGGILCEKVGVFNIALEGLMLFGAFFGVYAVSLTGEPLMALLAALAVGAIGGLIYVILVELLKTDATIASIGMNTFALGLTTYLMKMVFGDEGSIRSANIVGFSKLEIPWLEKIPFIGKVLGGHTVLVYVSLLLVILMQIFIYKTRTGINLRAVGENPLAATSAGISVKRYRIISVVVAGMLCGLAGVHLSLGYVTMFTENMTGGRGFFSYTAVVFGQSNPVIVMIACFVFGLSETLAYRFQQSGVPVPLVLTIPYVITVIALIIRNVRIKKTKRLIEGKVE